MSNLIFLGGTVGNNNWRDIFIKELIGANIPEENIFNPVVKDWNQKAQENEEIAKKEASHFLFYIADPKQDGINISAYSLVEATMALYDNQEKTVVIFDNDDLAGHILKAMNQSIKILKIRFPNANIFSNKYDGLEFFKKELLK